MKKLFKILLLCLIVCSFTLIIVGCNENKEEQAFNVKGVVTADGQPLCDAIVYCDTLDEEVLTNERGEYAFSNIKKPSIITVSKENYDFLSSRKSVVEETEDLNFEAFEQFSVSGKVTFDGKSVAGALVVANGLNQKQTITNDMGEFLLSGISGEVTISVTSSNYEFLDKVVTIADKDSEVIFTGRYEVFGNITFDGKPLSNVVVTDGTNTATTDRDGNYILKNICANGEITAVLDGYFLTSLEGSTICDEENKEINFVAYEKYDANVILNNLGANFYDSDIKLVATGLDEFNKSLNKEVVLSNEENILSDLYGNVKIVAKRNGATIAEKEISKLSADNVILNIFNTVKGKVVFDNAPLGNVQVTLKGTDISTLTNANGEFEFKKVLTTNEVEISLLGYQVEQTKKVVGGFETSYTFVAHKEFSVLGVVKSDDEAISDVSVLVDGNKVTETNENGEFEITNQIGQIEIAFEKEGYKTENITINKETNDLNIELFKYYTINAVAKSGDIVLEGAEVYLNNEIEPIAIANKSGEFAIENLIKENKIKVVMANYNTLIETITKQDSISSKEFNLSYNVIVVARTENTAVQDVFVKTDNEKSRTEVKTGVWKLELYGTNTISIEKDKYNFFIANSDVQETEIVVTKSQSNEIEFDSTYSLEIGVLADDMTNLISGVTITVEDDNGNELAREKTTNEMLVVANQKGDTHIQAFEENGGERTKTYMPRVVSFKSNMPNDIHFYDNAYEIFGYVTTGGIGIEGVQLVATNGKTTTTTYTDKTGLYRFDVLKDTNEISLMKAGYKFTYGGVATDMEKPTVTMGDSGKNVNFEAYYDASVVIKSGNIILKDAIVSVNGIEYISDEYGKVELKDLSGENIVRVTLAGYEFKEFTLTKAGEETIQGTFSVSGFAKSGDLFLEGVTVVAGGKETTTDSNGYFELTGLMGNNTLLFVLNGYTFDGNNKQVSISQENIEIDSSYRVSGRVVSGDVNIKGVVVSCEDKNTTTNDKGEFTITLRGTSNLTFVKTGYTFDSTEALKGFKTDFKVDSTYEIKGSVKSGDIVLGETKIIVNDNQTITASADGKFEIKDLKGKNTLTFEKTGYEIKSQDISYSSYAIEVNATYTVKGVVSNGSLKLNSVIVSIDGKTTTTDNEGYFEISGISGNQNITLSSDGYTFEKATVNGYSENLIVVDSTYMLKKQILYNGKNAVKGVNVTYDGAETSQNVVQTNSDGWFEITGIKGKITISLDLAEYTFDCGGGSTSFEISYPTEIKDRNIGVEWECFYVNGTVKFDSIVVRNAVVKVGTQETKTDENGNFEFKEYYHKSVGNLTVTATLNGATTSDVTNKDKDGNIVLTFDTSDKNAQVGMVLNAYDYLKTANFKMTVKDGAVKASHPLAGEQNQNNVKLVEQDGKGHTHIFYANYGKTNTLVVKVNPQVAQDIYYESNASGVVTKILKRKTSYSQDDTNGRVPSNISLDNLEQTIKSINWTEATHKEITPSDYTSKYGLEVNNLARYVINNDTVTSAGYEVKNGNRTFSFTMNNDSASTKIKIQMKLFSGQTISYFSYITPTYILDEYGRLIQVQVNEKYHVDQGGGVDPVATSTENYIYGKVSDIAMP